MKFVKKISALLLALLLVASISVCAFADGSVTYQGGAEKFVFLPGSEHSSTSLFNSFEGVMPGDKISQEIVVRNNFLSSYAVRIYMKAIPHNETTNPLQPKVADKEDVASMTEFLSQLSMTVKQGSKVLFNASPAELGGLSDYVLLGTFSKGGKTTLTVELNVPIELGNEYANRVGEVDWVFMAEQIPIDPNNPKTGDNSNIWLYAGLCGLCVVGVAAVLVIRKKKG